MNETLEEMRDRHAAEIADAGVETEQQLRNSDAPWPKSLEELSEYIKTLTDRPHDYGTCVYAMSLAATAAMHYVSSRLGCTGFQASFADLDILRRTRGVEFGKILDYDQLLYPQHCNSDSFPGWRELLADETIRKRLAEKASVKLSENPRAHPDVVRHWMELAYDNPA